MYNDIYYISQYLKDLGFTEDEIVDFYGIIYNSVEQSKDIESQIAYTGNRKYVEAFSLTSSVFGGDWYYYVKTEQRGLGGGGGNIDFDITLANAVNAPAPLAIETYVVGNDELVHPSVLYFKNGWNGYKYWMAFTPFAQADPAYENPSISVSNDGINWIIPNGLSNPIVPRPPSGFNADPCLYMDNTNTTMYCAYKANTTSYQIKVIKSIDGITWGNISVISTETTRDATSVCVFYDTNKYVMYAVDTKKSPYKMSKYESLYPDRDWSWIGYVGTLPSIGGKQAWHFEIKKIYGKYYIIYSTEGASQVYITKSTDMIIYETPVQLIRKDVWSQLFYKCSFILSENNKELILYYGVRSPLWLVGRTTITFNGDQNEKNLISEISVASILNGDIAWDSFNRANGVLSNAESGQAWVNGSAFQVLNNQLKSRSGSAGTYINIGVPNFRYKAQIKNYIVAGNWLTFRLSSNNFWRFNGMDLQKIVSGVISATFPGGEFLANDVIEIVCNGDSIKIYSDKVLVIDLTDNYNNTATNIGVQVNNNTSTFDSVLVSQI